jgi:hypothetical protein
MTTLAVRAAHYGFRQMAGMEWIKLRSLRSTWLTLDVFPVRRDPLRRPAAR